MKNRYTKNYTKPPKESGANQLIKESSFSNLPSSVVEHANSPENTQVSGTITQTAPLVTPSKPNKPPAIKKIKQTKTGGTNVKYKGGGSVKKDPSGKTVAFKSGGGNIALDPKTGNISSGNKPKVTLGNVLAGIGAASSAVVGASAAYQKVKQNIKN